MLVVRTQTYEQSFHVKKSFANSSSTFCFSTFIALAYSSLIPITKLNVLSIFLLNFRHLRTCDELSHRFVSFGIIESDDVTIFGIIEPNITQYPPFLSHSPSDECFFRSSTVVV